MCVCVCVCVCVDICIYFCVTFFISVYIMCVCLFRALSYRVGALQISIIIFIIIIGDNMDKIKSISKKNWVRLFIIYLSLSYPCSPLLPFP